MNTTENNTNLLLSRYIIKQVLKSGSDTTVYLAEHPAISKLLIIKQLRISDLTTERFYRETHILKHLKHPCIPLLYDILKDKNYYYIIEEYIKGESLKSVIDSGNLSFDTAIRYTLQLCDILKYLHEHECGSILYLDCRPDNIIISPGDTVHLIDYGSSIFAKDAGKRVSRYGSVGYAAPELYNNKASPLPATDIYGVGALLYYMLTGNSPLTDNSLLKNISPKKLADIIEKCLRHHPKRRYRNVAELLNALRPLSNISKNTKKENTSLVISIAGTDRRVGVTHLAMSLAAFLNKNRAPCNLFERCTPGILFRLLESTEASCVKTKNGSFEYKGLKIFPQYNETIETAEFNSITINDFGVLTPENRELFAQSDVCLLIGSGKAWEFKDICKLTKTLDSRKTIYIVNFTDGITFYRQTSRVEGTFLRMPYYDTWNSPGEAGKRFLLELTDEIKKRWKE